MERIVTLPKTGAVTTISVAAPAGLLLYNDHETASVTVSTSAAVSPDAGIVIRPKGQISWRADGEPIYGVANSPIDLPILVTDDIGELASPLDVAVATATRLASAGIPNVGLTEQIFYGNAVRSGMTEEFYVNTPLFGYASIIVDIRVNNPADLYVYQSLGNQPGTPVLFKKSLPITNGNVIASLPVVGSYIWFSKAVEVRVLGTNRTLGFEVLNRDTISKFGSPAVSPITFPRGVNTPLNSLGSSGGLFVHGGGMVTCRTYIKGSSAGIFTCKTAGDTMDLISSREMTAGDSGGTFGVGIVGLAMPPGAHEICFKAEVAGQHVLDITVIPER